MTVELTEEQKNLVYLRTNNTDNSGQMPNQNINMSYINSIPAEDPFEVVYNAACSFLNLSLPNMVLTSNIGNIANMTFSIVENDEGPKLAISLASFGASVSSTILFDLVKIGTLKYGLSMTKANFISFIVSTVISEISAEIISYELTKFWYERFETEFSSTIEAAARSHSITLNANNISVKCTD